jgi:hypothetical protein
MEPIELWHAIIDAEAAFHSEHGSPPTVLKLPILLAYDLAKLRRDVMGDLADRVMRDGVKVYEEHGLLGVKVELVRDGSTQFRFE